MNIIKAAVIAIVIIFAVIGISSTVNVVIDLLQPREAIVQRDEPRRMVVPCSENFVVDAGVVQCYDNAGNPVGKPFTMPTTNR